MVESVRGSAAAALGPIALGAVLGAPTGNAFPNLALVPAIVVGLTASTVPALYIATAITGSQMTAAGLARAVARGLEALGIVLLGLLAPLALVLATSTTPWLTVLLGGTTIAVAAVLGMRRMRAALIAHGGGNVVDGVLFVVWGGVALIVGARLFVEVVV